MTPVGPNTSPSDIYCKHCGYNLRASGDAKRCPECGRAFSPDDPKTFRSRPFAAPWKRSLARWGLRLGLLLLLIVLPLVAGCWWLDSDWKRDRAAEASLGLWELPREMFMEAGYIKEPIGWSLGQFLASRSDWVAKRLRRVRIIYMPTGFTDDDLRCMKDFHYLRKLFAVEMHITDDGLRHLREATSLQELDLGNNRITDAGLIHLRGLKNLTSLGIWKNAITNAGLDHLQEFTKLRTLYLGQTKIGDAGLAKLAALSEMETLYLDETQVTDAGLVHLARFPKLTDLSLKSIAITDAGLVHLEKLTKLECMELGGTNVTPAGIARLKAALPGCRIYGP